MRRSWLALIFAVVIIALILIIRAQSHTGEVIPSPKPATGTAVGPDTATAAIPTSATAPSTATAPTSATPPTTATAAPPARAVDPAKALATADTAKPAAALKLLSAALTQNPKSEHAPAIKARLVTLTDAIFFSPKPNPLTTAYTVVANDTLGKLAREHKTTIELIQFVNGLKTDIIHVGDTLKIIPGGFDVEVIKSQFKLTVYKDGAWVREFTVGLGKDGSTPVGEFLAGHRIPRPPYYGDGAPIPFGDKTKNPLGTRWVTVQGAGKGQYGIHGTWEPESMGKEASKGCVRMLNADVEWVYRLLVPGVSKITIKP